MATAGMNPAYLVDPSLYGDQQAIEQQRQLAQLLMTQGLTPQGNSEVIGGVAIRRSPMEGAAKLAQLLSGQGIQRDSNLASQDLMQRQAAAMGSMFGMGQQQPQGAPQGAGPALGAALGGQAAPATPAGALGLPGMSPMQSLMSYSMNPDKYMESYLKGFTPNDTTIQARQGGVDPQIANRLALIKASTDPKILGMQQAGMGPMQIYQALYGEAAKNAEIDRKAGNQFENPLTGASGMVPKIPENANPVGSPLPNGSLPGVAPIGGGAGVISSNAAAQERAKEENKFVTGVPGPGGVPTSGFVSDVVGAPASGAAPTFNIGDPAVARQQIVASGDKNLLAQFDRQYPQSKVIQGQTPAEAKGQLLSQESLDKRYTDLQAQNSVAQTTTSYLQSIKGLADKAATGQFSDKLQFVNSLVAQVPGVNERALDQASANNLLDKYSNQIVARLGQGGLGTDAARAILQSAYPNAHMTPAAIKEAADNLMGASSMIQAKSRLLSPAGNARDPIKYQQAEQTFDQNADPRMWQFANIKDPAAQKAFMQKVLKEDPGFLERAAKLHAIGAL